MANRPYPQRNPFPYQGTRSLEGVEAEADETSVQWATFETRPIKEATRFVERYLELQGTQPKGQPLAIIGAHGSGKTHAIFYARERLQRFATTLFPPDRQPFSIYVKAEGPDFPLLYREIAKSISLATFRDLAERFLASVASRQAGRDLPSKDKAESLKSELHRDPSLVAQIFESYVVEEGTVQASQAREVIQIAGGRHDFQHALSFLLTDQLAETAHRWFLGHNISLDDARKLGVSGPIASPEMAKWALQLVVTLFRRAERPFILYIDQFEKLLVDNQALLAQNAGLIHSLIEVIPRENGLFVLSGTDTAWLLLPEDLRQRFSDNIVCFPVLTLDEARQIVGVYLRSAVGAAATTTINTTGATTTDLWPFDDGAVREILRYGGGNIRRLLQICSGLFDEAFTEHRSIDGAFTASVLQRRTQMGFDESVIREEVDRVLTARAVRFARDYTVNNVRLDFSALDMDDTPRFFVQVTGAIFHNDEARRAQESLQLARRIHGLAAPPPLVLVVAGYVSPEVLATVQNIAQEVVIYRPDTFADRFGQVVERLNKAAPTSAVNPKERARADKQFAELKAHLEHLIRARDEEVRATNDRVAEVLQKQERSREQERREQARRDWAQERAKLEERIQEIRRQRKNRQFEELENARDSAQKYSDDRLNRSGMKTGAFFGGNLVVLGAMIAIIFRSSMFREFESFGVLQWLAIGGVLSGAGFLIILMAWLRPDLFAQFPFPFGFIDMRDEAVRFKDLTGSFHSLEQLKRAVLSTDETDESVDSRQLLKSKNPHLRYAVLVRRKRDLESIHLSGALRREPCAILRCLLATRLGESVGDSPDFVRDEIGDLLASVPEMIYYVEALARRGELPSGLDKRMTAAHRLVAGLAEPGTSGAQRQSDEIKWDSIALELVAELGQRSSSSRGKALLRAFEADVDAPADSELDSISSQQLRQALRELSPFDEGGLGTFDELQEIDTIEQLYLFFRQLQFLKERGLLSKDYA